VLGVLGGLVAWQLADLAGVLKQPNIYINDMLVGAVTGLSIGFLIGMAEGILSRSLLRGLRAGVIGSLLGLVAGAIALPLGEFLFLVVGGQAFGRALGWALFGALVGLADGITGGAQMWKAAVGGFIGGAIGGLLLEGAFSQFNNPLLGKVTGLMLLGGLIGCFTALIVVALSHAWLEVASGKVQGSEFILDKFLREKSHAAFIGSNVMKCDIALPDPDIAPQHASLKGAGSHFVLKDMSVGKGTYVNGRKVELHRLSDGERIRMGDTELVYHERR
jgi:hypothetical protein